MEEWYITKFKFEEILEKLLIIENPTEEIKEFGDYLIANILLCTEVADMKDEIIQQKLWDNIKADCEDLLADSLTFLKTIIPD
jgi:hypothetical protein